MKEKDGVSDEEKKKKNLLQWELDYKAAHPLQQNASAQEKLNKLLWWDNYATPVSEKFFPFLMISLQYLKKKKSWSAPVINWKRLKDVKKV